MPNQAIEVTARSDRFADINEDSHRDTKARKWKNAKDSRIENLCVSVSKIWSG